MRVCSVPIAPPINSVPISANHLPTISCTSHAASSVHLRQLPCLPISNSHRASLLAKGPFFRALSFDDLDAKGPLNIRLSSDVLFLLLRASVIQRSTNPSVRLLCVPAAVARAARVSPLHALALICALICALIPSHCTDGPISK